jgi:origin recognition complex subunit 1
MCSRLGKAKVVFSPYSSGQIEEILRHRLADLPPVFDDGALRLAARKVASVSGDVRRALELLRQAAELWEAEHAEGAVDNGAGTSGGGSAPEGARGKGAKGAQEGELVKMHYVTQAHAAMFSAAHMQVRARLATACTVASVWV